jgi:hypothetical protein
MFADADADRRDRDWCRSAACRRHDELADRSDDASGTVMNTSSGSECCVPVQRTALNLADDGIEHVDFRSGKPGLIEYDRLKGPSPQ